MKTLVIKRITQEVATVRGIRYFLRVGAPTEVNIIGSPSVNSMFTINDYGYIVSYTNFILSHELEHWQKHRRAAAFFCYGWGEGTASLSEEVEADRSPSPAVRVFLTAESL